VVARGLSARWRETMITYQTYNEIRFLRDRKSMSCARIARRLHLCPRTVKRWATRERYEPRKAAKRSSILDPYKPAIKRHWELGGCTYTSIFDSLRQAGYTGGQTIIKNYLRILGRKRPDREEPLVRPFEWMLRLVQGKLTADVIAKDLGASAPSEDVTVLV
jgi:transposase